MKGPFGARVFVLAQLMPHRLAVDFPVAQDFTSRSIKAESLDDTYFCTSDYVFIVRDGQQMHLLPASLVTTHWVGPPPTDLVSKPNVERFDILLGEACVLHFQLQSEQCRVPEPLGIIHWVEDEPLLYILL